MTTISTAPTRTSACRTCGTASRSSPASLAVRKETGGKATEALVCEAQRRGRGATQAKPEYLAQLLQLGCEGRDWQRAGPGIYLINRAPMRGGRLWRRFECLLCCFCPLRLDGASNKKRRPLRHSGRIDLMPTARFGHSSTHCL